MGHLIWALLLFAVQSDPLSGLWEGYYEGMTQVENLIQLELRLKGSVLEGAVITEAEKIPVENGRFSERDQKIHFEVYYASTKSRYIADGVLDGKQIKGAWKHERDHGKFELKRIGN